VRRTSRNLEKLTSTNIQETHMHRDKLIKVLLLFKSSL
jgi:hypothetical protein